MFSIHKQIYTKEVPIISTGEKNLSQLDIMINVIF